VTTTGAQPDRNQVVDLRLLPPAVAIWVAEATVLFCSGRDSGPSPGAIALTTSLVTIAVVAVMWVRRPRGRPAAVATVCALGLLAGSGLAWIHASALQADPLPELVRARAAVSAVVEVESVPTVKESVSTLAGLGYQWRMRANTVSLREGERQWNVRVPVLITGRTASPGVVADALPGTRLTLDAALLPGSPARPEAFRLAARDTPLLLAAAPWWQRAAAVVRASMRAACRQLPSDARGLLPGLAVGDESQLPPDLAEAMRVVGMSHLTAVSGSNLAIVTGLVLLILRRLRVRRLVAVAAAVCAMLAFVVVVGPMPSVERAAVMGAIALFAIATGRRRVGVSALLSAAVLLLLIDPWLSLSWGFALSVAATAGLLAWATARRGRGSRSVISGAGSERERRRGPGHRMITEVLAVAAVCELVTAPLVAAMGGGIPVAGILANALASPAVPVATVLGLVSAVVGLVAPGIAALLAAFAGYAASWIAIVARWAQDLPGAVLPWPGGALGGLSLAAVIGFGLVGWWTLLRSARTGRLARYPILRRAPGRAAATGLALVLTAALLTRNVAGSGAWPPTDWAAVFCDVGQGDATVLKIAPGHAALVDVGPEPKRIDRCLRDLGISTIDLLVLTHFHADHVEGLPGALAGRRVGSVMVSPLRDPPLEAGRVDGWLRAEQTQARAAPVGESGRVGVLSYRVLWPARFISDGSAPNNASVVLLVNINGLVMFLPGDLEPPAQQGLMQAQGPVHATVTKIPHHGSRNQDPELIGWSGSTIAVASVGKGNTYGHPSAQTLDAWRGTGAKVMRTDLDADVAVCALVGGQVEVRGRTSRQ